MPETNDTPAVPARLVKADAAAPKPLYPAARLIKGAVLEAKEAKAEADRVLAEARAEAKQLRDEAKEESDALRAQARQEGILEGTATFVDMLQNAGDEVDQLFVNYPSEVTKTAFRLAQEVLAVEFELNPQRIIDLVHGAVDHVRTKFPNRVLVHLHPDDFDLVESQRDKFTGLLADEVKFGFVKNAEFSRGDVQIETELGHYDFGVQSQLELLRQDITKRP